MYLLTYLHGGHFIFGTRLLTLLYVLLYTTYADKNEMKNIHLMPRKHDSAYFLFLSLII